MTELERAPVGLIGDILEMRAFARTREAIKGAAKDPDRQAEVYATPAGGRVLAAEYAAAQQRAAEPASEDVTPDASEDVTLSGR